jgi:hypothetical protein
MALTQVTNSMLAFDGGPLGMRNRIINGDMRIDQRNAGASVTQTTAILYTVDRWACYGSVASKFTVQQNAGSITPAVGYSNYSGVTSSSAYSVLSTDQFILQQRIEGFNISDLAWGTANAKTVTLSFVVYSSLTGTFAGAITNGTPNRSYPFTFSIASANTWTNISVTIAGDTSGTWASNNTSGIQVTFNLGAGSTFQGTASTWQAGNLTSVSGATSVVGTNGATFYITGVQLEVGSVATPFERRLYGQELMLCQRYAYKTIGSTGTYCYFPAFGSADSTTTAQFVEQFPVPMRSSSALTLTTTGTAANYSLYVAGAVRACTVVPTIGSPQGSGDACQFTATTTAVLTAGQACQLLGTNASSPYLLWTSEL